MNGASALAGLEHDSDIPRPSDASEALDVHADADIVDAAIDTGTIVWLLPEISSAFDAAVAALRTFRAGAAGVDRREVDLGPLRIARSHLHQAHGALEIVELAGIPKLTEAIEELLAGFEAEPGKCDATALDAIIGACRTIVEYLEDLQGGAQQQPLHLFPAYRDLLRARGADRIHPADLFHADLSIRPPREPVDAGDGVGGSAALGTHALNLALNEQRSAFEQGLLRYMRNDRDSGALSALARAVAAIEGIVASNTKQNQQRAFWWVARALFEALANDGFNHARGQEAHLKRLAGRVNLQIRKLVEGTAAVAERLFNDTLFFVAIAAAVTPHVREVQKRYRLVNAVPDDYETPRYGRIDSAALRHAREVLAEAKSAWSSLVAAEPGQINRFARATGALIDSVGPLKRRGLAQIAQVIDGIATDLGFDPRQPSAAVGLDVATALLFLEGALDRARLLDDAFDARAVMVVARVEASALGQESPAGAVDWLDRISREAEERLTMATFVAEIQANLRIAEKALDAFFRDPAERKGLAEAHKNLAQVSGALALLGHEDAHRSIDGARAAIARFEAEGDVGHSSTDAAAFEQLAQNLGAVGFYVEQIKRDRIDESAFHFDPETGAFTAEMARPPARRETPASDVGHSIDVTAAEAPCDSVGNAFARTDTRAHTSSNVNTEMDQAVRQTSLPASGFSFVTTEFDAPDVHETTLEEEIAQRGDDANALAAELRAHPEDQGTRDRLVAALEDVRRNAVLIDDRALQDEAAAALQSIRHAQRGGASVDAAAAAHAADALSDHVAELASHASRAAGVSARWAASAAPVAPSAPVPAEYNTAAIDAELLEIFLEEATTVLADARDALRALDADPANVTAMTVLRRGFHTLKGSGRMVGLTDFGDAAWNIEETFNGYLAEQRPAPTDLRSLADYAIRYMCDWVGELQTIGLSSRLPDTLIEAARAVRSGAQPLGAPLFAAPTAPPSASSIISKAGGSSVDGVEQHAHEASTFDAEDDFLKTEFASRGRVVQDDQSFAATQFMSADEALIDIEFFGVQPHIPVDATPVIADLASGEPELAARGAEGIARSTPPTEEEAPEFATDELAATSLEAEPAPVDASPNAASEVPLGNIVSIAPPEPASRVEETRRIGSLNLSVALFNIYLTESDDLLRVLTQDFGEWRHELDRYVSESAIRAAHSLAGSSATVGLVPAHDLAAALEDVLQTLWREPVELLEEQVVRLQDAVEALSRMLHRFAAERMPEPDPIRVAGLLSLRRELTQASAHASEDEAPIQHAADDAPAIDSLAVADNPLEEPAFETLEEPAKAAFADPTRVEPIEEAIDTAVIEAKDQAKDEAVDAAFDEAVVIDAIPVAEELDESSTVPIESRATIESIVPTRAPETPARSAVHDELDPDLLEVFTAEAGEILPQIGALLRAWQSNPAERSSARLLLRHLHTLKGSARMAGAMRLGEAVHDIEANVETAARLHEIPPTLLDELLAAHDRSLELFDRLHLPVGGEAIESASSAAASSDSATPAAGEAIDDSSSNADTPQRQRLVGAQGDARRAREQKTGVQQAVRVNSETLDRLVNLAGEVSISRARIENEVTQIKGALSDLGENVERLRAQLREIDLQAEFQLQSRMQSQQAAGAEREKFDPLEFDRFTRFQELTRMMAESVNDVKTVQQNLQKNLESADADLAAQRRMTRDLQQDLMRVRMVPFSNIAERLYRVARRAAKEVDKRVNLDIRGGSVEIDRSVLERMAGPFEHLLRNHIVHGIESRDERRHAGKHETGELLVEVRQEGNEIALTFSDDGAGLDLDRIRSKARDLGLVGANEIVSDARAAEFIFHAGFSTASEVTELAGRGVGMDVVRSEAHVLAGRVSVDSEQGKGTRFTINLPLTLAVTQVVLVAVAGRVHALPAVLVEQVQQLRPQPLADAYRAGQLMWLGEPVRLAFLGTLLGIEDSVPVAQRSSPVLILRSAGERIAIHVDDVVGTQEVVVKNLGPQLARMSGIAGATVLGSGEIVLILNPVQLAHMLRKDDAAATTHIDANVDNTAPATREEVLRTLPTVMVVDDSLTVRRVTQRLLSREGYQVVLAKDGVDALEQLQDYPPDVMLVDIEMPRMDGFDLTRNIRNDERYRHVPIIMITSRTAEKHRRHAAELGVDEYLGKPYQEEELLDLLARYVKARRTQSA